MTGTEYKPPVMDAIRKALERAGADENLQIAGTLWIEGALKGVGRPITTAAQAKKMRGLEKALHAAQGEFNKLDPLDQEWTRREVGDYIDHALRAVRWVLCTNPGGNSETKHSRFAKALKYFFESKKLKVSISTNSPFVEIFALCIGMNAESAKTTLRRVIGNKLD